MKKVILIVVLGLLWCNVGVAVEWEDLVEVKSYIDGHCYYTKMTKPEKEYDLKFESGSYKVYDLLINETCSDFRSFQEDIKKIDPYKAHLPFNGKITEINEKDLKISVTHLKDGKISEKITKKRGKLFYKLNNNTELVKEEFFNKNENLEAGRTYDDTDKEIWTIFKNKKTIFKFEENHTDGSIKLVENYLPHNEKGYYEINLDQRIFVFKTTNNVINSILIKPKTEYARATIKNYNNGIRNGLSFLISEDEFFDKGFYDAYVYENGKQLFKYSCMPDLSFETPIENNKEHGFQYHFNSGRGDYSLYGKNCYVKGVEVKEEHQNRYEICKENKLNRKFYRNKYFNNRYPNVLHRSYFDILNAYLKN